MQLLLHNDCRGARVLISLDPLSPFLKHDADGKIDGGSYSHDPLPPLLAHTVTLKQTQQSCKNYLAKNKYFKQIQPRPPVLQINKSTIGPRQNVCTGAWIATAKRPRGRFSRFLARTGDLQSSRNRCVHA
jgi:hypothetical protein